MRKHLPLLFILLGSFYPTHSFSQKRKLDSLLKLVEVNMADTSRVNLFVNISREYVYSDHKKATEFAEKGKELAQKINYTKGLASVQRNLGIIEFYKGHYKESIVIYEGAKKLAVRAGDSALVAQLNRATGISYDRLSNFLSAREYYDKALLQFTAINDSGGMASCYSSIGIIYNHYSAYEKTLEYYFKSLKIREGRKGEDRNIADLLNNIGQVYKAMGDNVNALKYYLDAVSKRELISDQRGLSISYNSIGGFYTSIDSLDLALLYEQKALDAASKVQFREVMSACYNQMGEITAKKKDYPKAFSYYMQSLQLDAASQDVEAWTTTYISLADLSIITGDLNKAEHYYLQARDTSLKYNFTEEIEKCYRGLAEIYNKKGDHEKAYTNELLAYRMRDTMTLQANAKAIAEMQALYDTEKKEKEIELQNEKLKVQDIDISRQRTAQYFYIAGIFLLTMLAFFIYRNFRQKQKNEKLLEQKNSIIEEKSNALAERNKDVTDSINYAKRIQEAILPDDKGTRVLFPDSFVLFLPRDIVSGDFYWHANKNGKKIIAAADCTGHGVPGAFMSMLGNAFLNEVVNQRGITDAGAILGELRHLVIGTLKQSAAEGENKDGMDISLLVFDEAKGSVEYAGANNPMVLVRNENGENKIYEYQPDKRPIGFYKGQGLPFTTTPVNVEKGDSLYIFTDGFADQFGGEKQKKFKYKHLKETLASIHGHPSPVQKEKLLSIFADWKGGLEQVDDILIIGIKV